MRYVLKGVCMLEKIETPTVGGYINFGAIGPDSHGVGRCFVYNAVSKHTKQGKPFITLYLRDIRGTVIPGYVFDLQSPLHAGGELTKVINNVVEIEWQENYLRSVGLTLIITKVSILSNISSEDIAKFRGEIADAHRKLEEIETFASDVLKMRVTLPRTVLTYSSTDYIQGRVGGLCEHYWRMMNVLKTVSHLSVDEYRALVATFVLYVMTHQSYVRAHDDGEDGIDLVSELNEKMLTLLRALNIGPGPMELINIFYGYQPKDIYVRNICAVSDLVKRIDTEFTVYQTIPLQQEGNAGYGTIRRYRVEEDKS